MFTKQLYLSKRLKYQFTIGLQEEMKTLLEYSKWAILDWGLYTSTICYNFKSFVEGKKFKSKSKIWITKREVTILE